MTLIPAIAQNLPPEAFQRERTNRRNAFFPNVRVFISAVFENYGDPREPRVFPVTPTQITVHSNSFHEADTFSVEFDATDFPLSPNLLRSGAAQVYLFQTGGIGQIPDVIRAADPNNMNGIEPTITGLFNEASLKMSNDGRSFSIDGIDYTSLFLRQPWLPRAQDGVPASGVNGRIPTGQPLDRVVALLMDQVPSARGIMRLEVINEGGTLPIVGASEGRTSKNGLPVIGAQNYWDVIYKLAQRAGYIAYVENLRLRLISLPAFIRERRANPRKMVWGRNILNLSLRRKLGREQVPIIETRAYDPRTRRVVRARFPTGTGGRNVQQPVNGLGVRRNEVRIINVPGIRSERALREAAESFYNTLGRSEQRINLTTMDLQDIEGSDLIELRTGDNVTIGFDSFNRDSVILEGMTVEQRIRTLTRIGYDVEVAGEIARSIDSFNVFRSPLRAKASSFDWSINDGLAISMELQNFVNTNSDGA